MNIKVVYEIKDILFETHNTQRISGCLYRKLVIQVLETLSNVFIR